MTLLATPMTRKAYDALRPRQQGYVSYMRSEHPGWDIPKANPYPKGSTEATQWAEGERLAVLDAQDGDDG